MCIPRFQNTTRGCGKKRVNGSAAMHRVFGALCMAGAVILCPPGARAGENVVGEINITVEPEAVHPGETVQVTVEIEAWHEDTGDDAPCEAKATECLPRMACPDADGEGHAQLSFSWVADSSDVGDCSSICYEATDKFGEPFAEECASVEVIHEPR